MPLNTPVNKSILNANDPRFDWSYPEVMALFDVLFMDLMFHAQEVHMSPHPERVPINMVVKVAGMPNVDGPVYCVSLTRKLI